MSPEDRLVHYRSALASTPGCLFDCIESDAHKMLANERPVAPDEITVEWHDGPCVDMVRVSTRAIVISGWVWLWKNDEYKWIVDDTGMGYDKSNGGARAKAEAFARARIAELTGDR